MNKIKGMLLYVSVQSPIKAYQKPGTDPKPDEWKASIAVTDEDFVDEFEEWASSIDAKISLKKIKTSAFKEQFKVDPPEDAGKNVWVFTFRRSTELGKTGKKVPEIYAPRVLEKRGNLLVDITREKLVGNGSTGQISLELFQRTNGTSSIYLKNVLVENLVEYVKPEGKEYNPGQEFLDEEDDDSPEQKPEAKPEVKADTTKKSTPRKPAKQEDIDEDVPF